MVFASIFVKSSQYPRQSRGIRNLFWAMVLSGIIAPVSMMVAQGTAVVPPVGEGAKPVAQEHIKIHGAALEGNLEGDAVDRDVIVFLPPSYEKDTQRH